MAFGAWHQTQQVQGGSSCGETAAVQEVYGGNIASCTDLSVCN